MSDRVAPRISARKRGRVTNTLEMFATQFKKNNPEKDCRWIYDPISKPELSGVMGRMAQGYRVVYGKDLGDETMLEVSGLKADEKIRVGDVVLMGVPIAVRDELREDNRMAAAEQLSKIDQDFYQNIQSIDKGGKESADTNLESRHRPRPIGRSVIEEREFEFDIEQRTGEEEG